MSFIGLAPVGSLLASAAAARIGASTTIALGGTAAILAGLIFGARLPRLYCHIVPISQPGQTHERVPSSTHIGCSIHYFTVEE